jgi:hypothetical protein
MVFYDFLKLFPHLVCQSPRSKAALNQMLSAGGGKGAYRKLQPCHTHALILPLQGEEGKQTGAHMYRDTGPWVQQ